MKIAFVSQPWDTLRSPVTSGSIPIWTYEVAKRLSADCAVTIYARRSEGQLAQEIASGVEYRRVAISGNRWCNAASKAIARAAPKFRYLNSRLYGLPYYMRVAADLRKQSCDVVHIHNFSQAVPIIRALNPTIRIVLHMHCEWLTQFEKDIVKSRLEKCDLVIGCSDYITNKVRSHFPQMAQKCQRVYNGVDVQQFTVGLRNVRQKQRVLFVGRISPEKGLHTLIEAFKQIADRFPASELQIIGPNKPTLAEFIADLSDDLKVRRLALLDPPNYLERLKMQVPESLAQRISFVGQVSHLQLQDYFQQSALLVNPSLSEAFGMSLVEAMASGVPVVATQVGGMTDVVTDGETGLLVPADDAEQLGAAIAHLLSDEALRQVMGQQGRQRAEDVFAWDAIASDLLSHYHALTGIHLQERSHEPY